MIVDNSAVIVLLLREPEAGQLERALLAAARADLPTPAYVECCLVLAGRFGEEDVSRLDRLVEQAPLWIVAFTAAHGRSARGAHLRFGKGRYPAGLNFDDCMKYAVAVVEELPLLYVGGDFGLTDVITA